MSSVTPPNVALYTGGGNISPNDADLTVGSYGLVRLISNAATPLWSITVGTHAPVTATNLANHGIVNGLYIGSYQANTDFANIEIQELIVYDGQLSAGDSATVLAGLTSLYGAGV
jgi:hypothetical protein